MIDLIRVSETNETIYWADVFRVVGIKRCRPVFHKIGVPDAIVLQPDVLVKAALHFWHHNWNGIELNGVRVDRGYSDPGFPENYLLGIQSLLQSTFAIIVSHYDQDDASRLYHWMQRFFVDQDQANLWFTWSILFSSLSKSQLVSSDFASEISPRIERTIQGHFGPAAQDDDTASLASIQRIPLSSLEQRMIELEVTQPHDSPEFDLMGLLKRVMQYDHAYRSWIEIAKCLSSPEREDLLWWGYEVAAELGMPSEDVKLPIIP